MIRALTLSGVALLLSAASSRAQQPFPAVPAAGEGSARTEDARQESPEETASARHYRLALDEFLVLVPIRDEDDIRRDIEDARTREERAQEEKRNTEQLERLARDQLEAQKREIDAIKARLKIAKNEDRESDVAVLESDRELAEGAKELLEKRRDLRREEIDAWESAARLAQDVRRAAELELELASARERLREAGPRAGVEELRRLERRVNEFEKRTLEAQKERADQRSKVARQEKDVVDARLRLLKTRAKIESGG